ncbi:IS1595 family transposase [Acetatifactor aquisgranensis]|uniref:IS1595 family transposase n=1 Tax=Acetatifactor aquisgranensis TaxID=2941233 RepID=UPI00203C7B0B|nr:IS1595 family transposase [Acetatifactor aquisgranensis]
MTTKELLISRLNQLSEEDIASLLDAANCMEGKDTLAARPDCPYCSSHAVIRYGHKCRKQRFFCKSCGKTFVPTTHTIMSNSHFPAEAWREVISDTVHGNAIDYTAQKIGCSHQAVFDMRHKVLMALQQLPEISDVCLGEVSEFDETFVLDCYKGKGMDGSIPRGPRRHGAKAQKRGISNEYVCICTGIQRKGDAMAATVNRAKPSAKELLAIFEGHIADGTLALCDGLRSYHALPGIAECIVKDCNDPSAEDTCFYNLNTVNGFHSFIKQRYVFYRGVASKYINRYNALFSSAYRNVEGIIKRLISAVLTVTGIDYYHSNRDVRESGLLAI